MTLGQSFEDIEVLHPSSPRAPTRRRPHPPANWRTVCRNFATEMGLER